MVSLHHIHNPRTIIAGSRTFKSFHLLKQEMEALSFSPSVILCGGAKGADALGKRYGVQNKIPVELYPANWKSGKSAGMVRNTKMSENADVLILFHDGISKGSEHMKNIALKKGLIVVYIRYSEDENEKQFIVNRTITVNGVEYDY